MQKFNYILSPRFHALSILFIIGFVAVFSSADTFTAFVLSKIVGIALLAICYALGIRWYRQGHMDWIDELLDGEE